jgi:hypothetical protein
LTKAAALPRPSGYSGFWFQGLGGHLLGNAVDAAKRENCENTMKSQK